MLQVIHTTPRSRRAPGGVFAPGGGGPAHAAWERLLLSLCLLASLLLLYRCLAITGGLLFGGGGSSSGDGSADTVISVTTAGAASITVLSSRRAAGRQAPAQQQPGGVLPRDFDAQAYLLYHPDLRQQGIKTEAAAKQHYLSRGRAEGRPYRRLRVLLRYTACTGLINQQYSHIAAFTLAAALGAELVLPPAMCRDSFGHLFSVFKEQNEMEWTPVPLETLLDVDAIVEYWRQRGLAVHRTPALQPFPDITQPEVAFPRYPLGDLDPSLMTRMGDIYMKDRGLSDLTELARAAVVDKATSVLREDPGAGLPYIVLDLPCSFFSLRTLSNLPAVTEVAKSLKFAPKLVAMADRIVAAMAAQGVPSFNGVHLRVERDASDWARSMGGQQVLWNGYLATMRGLGFNSTTPLYVASGMLTYGASVEMDRTKHYLVQTGVCSKLHHKELYIPQPELEALNSEQKALLDFLVLARSRRFAGFGSSTFSFYLREYRVLQGLPRSASGLVDSSVIGTDPLFHSAGTVV